MESSHTSHGATSKAIRIVLVEDHPVVRDGLSEFISRQAGFQVCGVADDCDPAIVVIEATRPHIVVLDLTLKSSQGMDVIAHLRVNHPEIRVLILSVHDETVHAERAIRSGAHGYINKQETVPKILAAIKQVMAGEIYLSPRVSAQIASRLSGRPHATSGAMTDILGNRELQVYQLIGTGLSSRQIAEKLQLDISTVDTNRARIKKKLRLKDANDLLQSAIRWNRENKSVD